MPESDKFQTSGQMPLGFWTPFWSVMSVIAAAAIYASIYRNAQSLKELFQGFGTDLPLATKLYFATYPYFPLLILIGLIPTVMLIVKRRVPRDEVSGLIPYIAISFGLSLAVLALSVVASYLPIFALGSVVE